MLMRCRLVLREMVLSMHDRIVVREGSVLVKLVLSERIGMRLARLSVKPCVQMLKEV